MQRLEVSAFLNRLRQIYAAAPSRLAMRAVLNVVGQLLKDLRAARKAVTLGSLQGALSKWDDQLDRLRVDLDAAYQRLDGPDWQAEVVGPWLRGEYPSWYWGGPADWTWAEAQVAAMLWNQLLEAAEVEDSLRSWWHWDTAHHWMGELFTAASAELAEAAPGEPPGIVDKVKAAMQSAVDAVGDVFVAAGGMLKTIVIGVGVGLGVWALVKLFSK